MYSTIHDQTKFSDRIICKSVYAMNLRPKVSTIGISAVCGGPGINSISPENKRTSHGNIGGYLSLPYMQQLQAYMCLGLGVNTRKTFFHSEYVFAEKKYLSHNDQAQVL